jgi:Ribonuclease G/E
MMQLPPVPPQVPEGYTYREVPYAVTCPVCYGTGHVLMKRNQPCPQCSGAGRITAMRWEVVPMAQIEEERRRENRAGAIALVVFLVILVVAYVLIHSAAVGNCSPPPGLFDWPTSC